MILKIKFIGVSGQLFLHTNIERERKKEREKERERRHIHVCNGLLLKLLTSPWMQCGLRMESKPFKNVILNEHWTTYRVTIKSSSSNFHRFSIKYKSPFKRLYSLQLCFLRHRKSNRCNLQRPIYQIYVYCMHSSFL